MECLGRHQFLVLRGGVPTWNGRQHALSRGDTDDWAKGVPMRATVIGAIEPGRVFDRTIELDDVPDGYRAMADRQALKILFDV
jgi:threonine dehydrogenase-like Zn-dependent dehydrogenase